MKNIIKTGLACGMILLTGTLPAQARGGHDNDEAIAAIGGFIGGVILSEVLHDHDNHNTTYQVSYEYSGRDDRHERNGYGRNDRDHPNKNCGYAPSPKYRDHRKCDCGGGYWKRVERRVFVPASFVWKIDSCGQRVRIYKPGCWKTVTDRVWISGHGPRCGRG